MRSNYEDRAKQFIQQIFPYIEDCETHDERLEAVLTFNSQNHRKVKYAHGSSRYALISSDYVVKVDYRHTCWGTSEDEIELYNEAVQDGFEYLFAKISRYQYRDRYFYIMPRIEGVGSTPWDADEYLEEDEADWCWYHVCDLHNENYGWKNGHVVIIDYAARRGR